MATNPDGTDPNDPASKSTIPAAPGSTASDSTAGTTDLTSLNASQITDPTLPKGGVATATMMTPNQDEMVTNHPLGGATTVKTATQDAANTAVAPSIEAKTYNAATVDPNQLATMQSQEGQVGNQDLVTAQQGQISDATTSTLDQFDSWMAGQTVDPNATVQAQYAKLMDFEPGQVPAWAKGAYLQAQQSMAARGITGSTMAGQAVTTALMQAALPIASQDAQVFQTMQLKQLDSKQQSVFLKAGFMAQMDMKNLDNRQQAAVANAQTFMSMDMSNLNNRQQAAVINTQARIQGILSNQAATNAAGQFNASSENQVNEFMGQMATQVSQFNAEQTNGMKQFNAGQTNTVNSFNASQINARDQFNSSQQAAIDQSNAVYLRGINTANTAAINATNLQNSQNIMEVSNTAMANGINLMRDQQHYVFQANENGLDRANNRAMMLISRNSSLALQNNQFNNNMFSGIATAGASVFKDLIGGSGGDGGYNVGGTTYYDT